MGLVNLGGGSFKDYQEWTKTPAGQQSAADHRAKYGDQSKSQFPVIWQPGQNWQRELSVYRRTPQPSAPDMGTYSARQPSDPNRYYNSAGQPFGGSISFAPGTSQEQRTKGYEAYANKQGYYRPQQSPSRPVTRPEPPRPSPSRDPFAGEGGMYYRPAPAYQPLPQNAPAQPIQPQPQGTPYNPMQPMAFAPPPTPFSFTMPMGPPSLADLSPDQRPPGFQQSFTDPFGNQTTENPMAQRDAMIEMLNRQMLPYQMGQQQGRPSFNLPAMWQQAGDMVQGGWTNPLAGLFG